MDSNDWEATHCTTDQLSGRCHFQHWRLTEHVTPTYFKCSEFLNLSFTSPSTIFGPKQPQHLRIKRFTFKTTIFSHLINLYYATSLIFEEEKNVSRHCTKQRWPTDVWLPAGQRTAATAYSQSEVEQCTLLRLTQIGLGRWRGRLYIPCLVQNLGANSHHFAIVKCASAKAALLHCIQVTLASRVLHCTSCNSWQGKANPPAVYNVQILPALPARSCC